MLRKIFSILMVISFLLIFMPCTTSYATLPLPPETPIGDVNGDTKINSIDIVFMQRYILGIIDDFPVDDDLWSADVNGDGHINSIDYSFMKRFLLNIIDKFPKVQEIGLKKLELGAVHTSVFNKDGTVWVWGGNSDGQLGLGEITGTILPSKLTVGSNVKKIVSGLRHMVALNEDGSLLAWGNNDNLQLIDDTEVSGEFETKISNTPFSVISESGIKDIQAGYNRTLLVKEDGTVWLYAASSFLNSTNSDIYLPYEITGLKGLNNTSLGLVHVMGLKEDGTVLVGGDNYWGQLGTGEQNHHNSSTEKFEISQIEDLTGIIAISAGKNHSVALKEDGTVWTWGCSLSGELGYGVESATKSIIPGKVEELEDVVQISAGNSYTAVLKNDGTVWTFGRNMYGQLGDGSTSNKRRPVQVEGLTGVVD